MTVQEAFTDVYSCMARNIEDSLMQSGAIPGKDYTTLDLYKLAQPFVLDIWKTKQREGKPLEFRTAWPQPAKKDD